MVLRQGMTLAIAGLAAGLVASLGARRLLAAAFGNTQPPALDVIPFLLVASSVLAVTLLATYLPARRASRIDPVEALRYD
jgi:putative ABC transport system permease protein